MYNSQNSQFGVSESPSEKTLKTQGHFTADLVSLDFKSESLQKFLQNVVAIVNQHSYKLNRLESSKLNVEPATETNLHLCNSISLSNSTLLAAVSLKKDPPTSENKYGDSVSKLGNKLDLYNQAIDVLYKRQDDRDSKFSNLQSKVGDLVTAETLRDRLKKTKDEGQSYTDQQINKILNRLKDLQLKTNKKIGDFENLTKELEKKTLWRISECEKVLTNKITAEYVDKSNEQLQQKILRDIKNSKSSEGTDFKFQMEIISKNLENTVKDTDAKTKEMRKAIKELESEVKTFEKKDKADSDKREIQAKLKDHAFKIDRLERREDPVDLDLRLTKSIVENSEKATDLAKRLKHLEEEFDSLNDLLSKMGGQGGMNDPHKICHLDAQLKRLKDSSRSHDIKIGSLDEQLKTKLLIFEQRINASIAMMRNQQNNVSREELYESINRLKQPVNERLQEYQNLINELGAKAQKMELFEKATKRKIKQLTKGEDLNKILEMKMNTSEAKIMLDGLNNKIENVEVYFNKLRMEVEGNSSFLKEIHEKMGGVEEGFSIISSKQKIFPAKCLACGVKHLPHRPPGEMQGTDGRFYRVDIKNTCVYDQQEIFDVVPSQIALVQTAKRQGRISSAKGRRDDIQSTGGATHSGFRPQSAKRV